MELKRTLGLSNVVSTSAGLTFATSSFIAAAQTASFLLGDSAWIALLVAGGLVLLAAGCFSELNGLYPSAAGLRLYLGNAWGDRAGIVVSLIYMFVITTVIGTETYALSHALSYGLPQIPPIVWLIVLLGGATLINVRGLKLAAGIQDLLTYVLVASLIVFSLIALGQHHFTLAHPLATGGAGQLFNAVAVGIFLFVAFEWVTPLAEEVTDSRLISRGMMLAIGLLTVVYGLFTIAMRQALPAADLASPIPQILLGKVVLGAFGVGWMTLISLIASLTTFNAGMITVSRFMYASSREGLLPKALSRINLKYATPQTAIYTLFGVAFVASLIVLWSRHYLLLVNVGAATESLVYTAAALAVWRLRKTKPDLPRPYRLWGGRALAMATAVIFFVLAVGVFASAPGAAAYLLLATLAALAWVKWGVPVLKARREAEQKARSRRPSRRPGGPIQK